MGMVKVLPDTRKVFWIATDIIWGAGQGMADNGQFSTLHVQSCSCVSVLVFVM